MARWSATPVTCFSSGLFLAYPHANGFSPDGDRLVLGQTASRRARLWMIDLSSGEESVAADLALPATPQEFWFDYAAHAERLVTVLENQLHLVDLAHPSTASLDLSAHGAIHPLPSITSNGSQIVVTARSGDRYRVLRIDVETGAIQVTLDVDWFANHVHFSPHDETWIGFCHEGPADTILDRVWAWHATHVPLGRCLFDQRRPDGPPLRLGHEVWCRHDTSALVVAFGINPATPTGIYEVFVDERPPRLVSRGRRDWHVNASSDGRWAVVDTTGPFDRDGCGWENADQISDIVLVDMLTGERRWLARSRTGAHPFHPHPVFSPDGRHIYYNEQHPQLPLGRVMRVENPWA